ncbi:C40 family peptidase [Rhodoferax aquaticus]|uniref:Peptidoglycan endopeptidase n=1 Tax=Rhodoferax aquaticus TaxID=2527691 RepID=A0A515ESX1_9BURK|nr:C40 family peptidase [Rhodoferax aquaticus]QDL55663.1 peptidoglycan endopeptidase [Rhodoferax aquaticus]
MALSFAKHVGLISRGPWAPVRAVTLCVLVAVLCGCASAPPPAPVATLPPPPPVASGRLSEDQANDVTLMAIGLVGTPYRYGGNTPAGGFDCSGLIAYVYKERAGVLTPRSVAAMADWGQPVAAHAVKTGDLAIFIQDGRASHAGIYVGEGRFVHAPSTGGVVRLDPLQSKYWAKVPVRFRRP